MAVAAFLSLFSERSVRGAFGSGRVNSSLEALSAEGVEGLL